VHTPPATDQEERISKKADLPTYKILPRSMLNVRIPTST
jgi:hypothetical protein